MNRYVYFRQQENNYLAHHGIKGQKWGIRRYQNEDGTLTPEGRERYGLSTTPVKRMEGSFNKRYKAAKKQVNEGYKKYVKFYDEEAFGASKSKAINDALNDEKFIEDFDKYMKPNRVPALAALGYADQGSLDELRAKYPQYAKEFEDKTDYDKNLFTFLNKGREVDEDWTNEYLKQQIEINNAANMEIDREMKEKYGEDVVNKLIAKGYLK